MRRSQENISSSRLWSVLSTTAFTAKIAHMHLKELSLASKMPITYKWEDAEDARTNSTTSVCNASTRTVTIDCRTDTASLAFWCTWSIVRKESTAAQQKNISSNTAIVRITHISQFAISAALLQTITIRIRNAILIFASSARLCLIQRRRFLCDNDLYFLYLIDSLC